MPRGRRPGAEHSGEGCERHATRAWVVNAAWWWTLRTVDPDATIRLVGAILRDTPSLPCRTPGWPTWGNEDPDCRIDAGHRPLPARSPVVGKSDMSRREGAPQASKFSI
jgi:hypothetical protein